MDPAACGMLMFVPPAAALSDTEVFRATCVAVCAGSGARTWAVDGNAGAFPQQGKRLT